MLACIDLHVYNTFMHINEFLFSCLSVDFNNFV